jgi:hypothetical protein
LSQSSFSLYKKLSKMEDQNEKNNDEREIQADTASLGDAQRINPDAPLAMEIPMSPLALDRRQAAFSERRRYVGPQSDDEPEGQEGTSVRYERNITTDTPPTPCADPPTEEVNE